MLHQELGATAQACTASHGLVEAESQQRGPRPCCATWPHGPRTGCRVLLLSTAGRGLLRSILPFSALPPWLVFSLQSCCTMAAAGSGEGSQVCCYCKGKKDRNVSAQCFLLLKFLCAFSQQTDTRLISPCVKMLIKKNKPNQTNRREEDGERQGWCV